MLTFPVRTMPSIFPCLKSCIGLPQSNCDTCRSGDDSVVWLEMERHRAGFQKEYLKLVGGGLTSVMSGEMEKPHQRTSARYRNHPLLVRSRCNETESCFGIMDNKGNYFISDRDGWASVKVKPELMTSGG
jgi:hypothetical protein